MTTLPDAGTIPVFPLPKIVLFPGASLPLHVFEPRYRALVKDALLGDRRFAMALLRPGYEPVYEGNPAIYPVGCAGRIEEVVPLPDGRFLLTLRGTDRVELGEMTESAPYRRHAFRCLPELSPDPSSPAAEGALLRLVSAYQQILTSVSGQRSVPPLPVGLPFAETVNRIAFLIDIDILVKYRLLENGDLLARAERLATLLESALPSYLDLGGDSVN